MAVSLLNLRCLSEPQDLQATGATSPTESSSTFSAAKGNTTSFVKQGLFFIERWHNLRDTTFFLTVPCNECIQM
jgi:hypothetical protein